MKQNELTKTFMMIEKTVGVFSLCKIISEFEGLMLVRRLWRLSSIEQGSVQLLACQLVWYSTVICVCLYDGCDVIRDAILDKQWCQLCNDASSGLLKSSNQNYEINGDKKCNVSEK